MWGGMRVIPIQHLINKILPRLLIFSYTISTHHLKLHGLNQNLSDIFVQIIICQSIFQQILFCQIIFKANKGPQNIWACIFLDSAKYVFHLKKNYKFLQHNIILKNLTVVKLYRLCLKTHKVGLPLNTEERSFRIIEQ